MNLLALVALFLVFKKPTPSSTALNAPRRQVKGESGKTWYVSHASGAYGVDSTKLMLFQVFASATGSDLVIAYVQFPEVAVYLGDGGKPVTVKDKRARALFYAAPSSLTKAAIADFCESDNFIQ